MKLKITILSTLSTLLLCSSVFGAADPLTMCDTNRYIPFANGPGYSANTYQYYLHNTGEPIVVQSGPNFYSVESGSADSHVASNVWSKLYESKVPVAVLDPDGFDPQHEDLVDNVVLCTNSEPGVVPVAWHGTAAASIVGAVGDNGIGMSGVCKRVPLLLIKYTPRSDISFSNAVSIALNYGARVICLPSWCYGSIDNSNTIARAACSNCLVVCSAPNSPIDLDTNPDYPSSFKMMNVLSVSCSMMNNTLLTGGAAWGSNTVFCSAPGRRVPVCTTGTNYGFSTGSSFSVGVVSGLAALLCTYYPNDSYLETRARLAASVTPAGQPTLTGGVVDGRCIDTTILRLIVNGPAQTVASSTNLSSWEVQFVRPNNNATFFRAY